MLPLKVYFYFKKEKEAGLYAKKSAFDAVLFRGISAGAAGCFNQAFVNSAQIEKKYIFPEFLHT
jgi:hypothetical protein